MGWRVVDVIFTTRFLFIKKKIILWLDFNNDDMLDELFVEDALNWLDDLDNPYGTSKIWKYLNS